MNKEAQALIDAADQYKMPLEFYKNLQNNFQAPSFIMKRPSRNVKSSELITDLIKKSIAEQAAITRKDIHLLYWLYKTDGGTREMEAEREYFPGEGWKNITFDKEGFINHWRYQRNAISWFKAALSSAILEGKLLVLPIIEI